MERKNRKGRIKTGDFAQQANADEGKRRKDTEIFENRKGETRITTIGMGPLGKNTQMVEVL